METHLPTTADTRYVAYYRVSTTKQGKKDQRQELERAIAYAKAHKARLVIAKLDRLSRNAAFIYTLRDTGVDFVCADMPEANALTIGIFAAMAQHERETISKRTKEALRAKKSLEPDWKPGTPENLTQEARNASLETRRKKAQANENNRRAAAYIKQLRDNLVPVTDGDGKEIGKRQRTWREIAAQLNEDTYRTSKGGEFQATQVMRLYAQNQA